MGGCGRCRFLRQLSAGELGGSRVVRVAGVIWRTTCRSKSPADLLRSSATLFTFLRLLLLCSPLAGICFSFRPFAAGLRSVCLGICLCPEKKSSPGSFAGCLSAQNFRSARRIIRRFLASRGQIAIRSPEYSSSLEIRFSNFYVRGNGLLARLSILHPHSSRAVAYHNAATSERHSGNWPRYRRQFIAERGTRYAPERERERELRDLANLKRGQLAYRLSSLRYGFVRARTFE